MAVIARLIEARSKCVNVECDGSTSSGAKFEYASAGAIAEAARWALNEVGLMYRTVFEVQESAMSEDGKCRWVRVKLDCWLSDADETLEQPFTVLGEALDYGDNATTKAQTDALKSLWLSMLAIIVVPRGSARNDKPQQSAPRANPGPSVQAVLALRKQKDITDEGFNNLVCQVNNGVSVLVKNLSDEQRLKLISNLMLVADRG